MQRRVDSIVTTLRFVLLLSSSAAEGTSKIGSKGCSTISSQLFRRFAPERSPLQRTHAVTA